MLLIIDNKSKFIKKFEKELKKQHISYKKIPAGKRIDLGKLKHIQGLILTGGSLGIYSESITNDFIALMNFNVPVIGFCMGHEVIAVAYGGQLKKLPKHQYKIQEIVIDAPRDPIFRGLDKRILLREKHYHHVARLPKQFNILAHSDICPIEVMRHKRKKIYGFQSHPEVSGQDGHTIMKNFLKMCGIRFR